MHDSKGRELKAGDIVIIPVRIKEVFQTEDYCNVSAESVFGRRPDDARETFNSINTAVMLRANPGDENDLSDIAACIADGDAGEDASDASEGEAA